MSRVFFGRGFLSFVCVWRWECFFLKKWFLYCCKTSLQKSVWENSESFCLSSLLCSGNYHLKHVVKITGKWAISPVFVNDHILYIPQFHESYKGKFPLASWLNKHLFLEAVKRTGEKKWQNKSHLSLIISLGSNCGLAAGGALGQEGRFYSYGSIDLAFLLASL